MTSTQQAIITILIALLIALVSFLGTQIYSLVKAKIKEWNEKISSKELESIMTPFKNTLDGIKNSQTEVNSRFKDYQTSKEVDAQFALRDERTENLSEKIDELRVMVNVRLDDLPEQLADKIESRLNKGKR
jgi:Na+-translocating ferredoxin:NAD+ oxidoreductase RnfG subunit